MGELSASTSKAVTGGIHVRLAVASAYLTACAVIGIQVPFLPLFLADRGMGPAAISLALALPMTIRLAAMPLAGIYSDRLGAPRTVLAWLGILSALGFALIGVVPGVLLILVAIAVSAIFWTPIFPLLDAYTLRLVNIGKVDYGRVRLWGSASFIAANLLGGYLLDWMPVSTIIWLIAGFCFLFMLTARALPLLARPLGQETSFNVVLPKKRFCSACSRRPACRRATRCFMGSHPCNGKTAASIRARSGCCGRSGSARRSFFFMPASISSGESRRSI